MAAGTVEQAAQQTHSRVHRPCQCTWRDGVAVAAGGGRQAPTVPTAAQACGPVGHHHLLLEVSEMKELFCCFGWVALGVWALVPR